MARIEMIGIPNAKKRVEVTSGNHVVITDYTVDHGGGDAGPSMGAVFLAGLVACTASTARGYCKKHDLPIPDKVITTFDMDDETELITNVDFKIIVPEGFPEKRLKALVRASGQCTVKDWWVNPPSFTANAVIE